MWIYYNPNPVRSAPVGDCSVRAIAKALDVDWDTAHDLTAYMAKQMGDIQNANAVWGARRDSMGRYASSGYARDEAEDSRNRMMQRLQQIMHDTPDERTRRKLDELASEFGGM